MTSTKSGLKRSSASTLSSVRSSKPTRKRCLHSRKSWFSTKLRSCPATIWTCTWRTILTLSSLFSWAIHTRPALPLLTNVPYSLPRCLLVAPWPVTLRITWSILGASILPLGKLGAFPFSITPGRTFIGSGASIRICPSLCPPSRRRTHVVIMVSRLSPFPVAAVLISRGITRSCSPGSFFLLSLKTPSTRPSLGPGTTLVFSMLSPPKNSGLLVTTLVCSTRCSMEFLSTALTAMLLASVLLGFPSSLVLRWSLELVSPPLLTCSRGMTRSTISLSPSCVPPCWPRHLNVCHRTFHPFRSLMRLLSMSGFPRTSVIAGI
nr:34.5 kDa unknown protein [Oyster mushroom spherical virus]